MEKYFETKIGNIIAEEFDHRIETAVFSYIISKGIDCLKGVTEEEIQELDGNPLMTKSFVQSLVRCGVRIAKECDEIEIMKYIRCYLSLEPQISDVYIHKDDVDETEWEMVCENMDIDPDEATEICIHGFAEVTE